MSNKDCPGNESFTISLTSFLIFSKCLSGFLSTLFTTVIDWIRNQIIHFMFPIINQDGHCPGNQGKVRENEKLGLKWSGKSHGI